jgi:glutamate N-acetyltransferase/amino-acid N-acetyltransferase
MCEEAAEALGIEARNVGVASTGIIGRRLNIKEVTALIRKTSRRLGCSGRKSLEAAKTIMTTDTKPKMCSVEYKGIEVGGIAKGAGMIAPNMATMLCFITTNADIGRRKLEDALKNSVAKSFNMIVVDSDESTNDTVLLMSNKKMKCKTRDFQKALDYVTTNLAKKIAQDGEGATKFIELSVVNAKDDETARRAVRAVLSSPLVKTAFYGENPNWGRIVSKLGSVTKVDEEKVRISFSDGVRTHEFNILGGFDLKKIAEILKSREIKVVVNLKSGTGRACGWGCDMSLDYVKVNAEYN